jgi:hypothetical protein
MIKPLNLRKVLIIQQTVYKLTNFSESASRKYISALMLSKDHLTTMLDTVTAALDEKDMKKEDIIKKETEREVTVKKENGDS